MKIKSYKFLFRFFSFLSDKTNGFPLFVKAKLALGTLILGLAVSSCGGKNTNINDDVSCYIEISPLDVISDTISISQEKQSIGNDLKADSAENIVSPPLFSEIPVLCYDLGLPADSFKMPQFRDGGQEGFMKWFHENFTYPEELKDRTLIGKIKVNFIIDREGRVKDVEILEGLEDEKDTEIVFKQIEEILLSSPQWIPGSSSVSYILPVSFKQKENED